MTLRRAVTPAICLYCLFELFRQNIDETNFFAASVEIWTGSFMEELQRKCINDKAIVKQHCGSVISQQSSNNQVSLIPSGMWKMM